MKNFDVVVIGSGNAGLTAATTLQRAGIDTLLLERHNVPGGCGTSFVRGDYEFEAALHQLSGMGTEEQPFIMRKIFNDLGIMDRVEFIEEKDLYRFTVPGVIDITLPASIEGIKETLCDAFPSEARAISKYLKLCEAVAMEAAMVMPRIKQTTDEEDVKRQCPNIVEYGLISAREVLDSFFDDERLKAVLGTYWGYMGLPLNQLPFVDMGTTFHIYAQFKPYYVKGGSQAISNAMLESFLDAGGEVRFNCAAEKILTEDGAVQAVRTEQGDEVECAYVVSNSSSIQTYNELLDKPELCGEAHEEFKSRRIGVSAFVIYMGLDCTPEELGLETSSHFISETLDDAKAFERVRTLNDSLAYGFTCHNVDDPSAAPAGKSVGTLLSIQYGSPWDDVAPEDYAKTKYKFANRLIDQLQTLIPNLREHIEEVEVATPLTMRRYLNSPGGAFYGFDQNVLETATLRKRHSLVDGLYLAGAWVSMGGFQPTYMNGVGAAKSIIKQHSSASARK